MESQKFIAEMAEFGKNIGEDVVEQILSILPPKTLMRFKCVSKKWYALIISHRFVAKHLSNCMHKKLSTSTCVLLKHLVQKDTNTDETEEVFSFLNFQNDKVNDGGDERSVLISCEDVKIPLPMSLETRGESFNIIGHCNGIICLAMANSRKVLLWNPAIEEFKLLPTLPYLPDQEPWWRFKEARGFGDSPKEAWCRYMDALGFGYCPKSNDYKVVNIDIGFCDYEHCDLIYIYLPPTAAVYTLGIDSWRVAKSSSLETETTLLWPERFQMYFKGMCYWLGKEQHKEIHVYDWLEEEFIRKIIILFDTDDEVFHAMLLPDRQYSWGERGFDDRLLVWNESVAVFGTQSTYLDYGLSFGIWVMDEFGVHKGAWIKHLTFKFTEKPLTFLKSDEIFMSDEVLMTDTDGFLFSYNLSSENLKYLPIQSVSNDSAAVVYVASIVSLLQGNEDNSSNADFSMYKYSPFSYSMVDKECYSYSVWAIPSDDVSFRIMKLMESLRTEFVGPEIKPHIPVVGSVCMTRDEVLSKFTSLHSHVVYSYKAKVDQVVTRNFYYQCVSLLIDSSFEVSSELREATKQCSAHFGFYKGPMPRLSLFCGNLTSGERKLAQEKVNVMDRSITSLSFPITRLALYKVDYKDTTLNSWEKIAEYPLLLN